MTRSDNLVLETRKEGSPTARAALRQKLSLDENGDVAVGQHLYGLTAEHDGRHAAAPMRGHCDQVTAVLVRGIDDGAVGMLVAWSNPGLPLPRRRQARSIALHGTAESGTMVPKTCYR